jgi:hypothetical protein
MAAARRVCENVQRAAAHSSAPRPPRRSAALFLPHCGPQLNAAAVRVCLSRFGLLPLLRPASSRAHVVLAAASCACVLFPPAHRGMWNASRCADATSPFAAALCRCGCAQTGRTPLHYAAWHGHVACVTLLVERGADKEATNEVRCAAPLPPAVACCTARPRLCSAALCAAQWRCHVRARRQGAHWHCLLFH